MAICLNPIDLIIKLYKLSVEEAKEFDKRLWGNKPVFKNQYGSYAKWWEKSFRKCSRVNTFAFWLKMELASCREHVLRLEFPEQYDSDLLLGLLSFAYYWLHMTRSDMHHSKLEQPNASNAKFPCRTVCQDKVLMHRYDPNFWWWCGSGPNFGRKVKKNNITSLSWSLNIYWTLSLSGIFSC